MLFRSFMIQVGDPTETGRGGESIWGKDFKYEANTKTFDKAGILAMANRGPATTTNGSQFFITVTPKHQLNGGYTIFGQVVGSTIKNVNKLSTVTTGKGDRPIKRQEIIKAYIKK